jgi:hypothetical protein
MATELFRNPVWKALRSPAVHARALLEQVLLELFVQQLHPGSSEQKSVMQETIQNLRFFLNGLALGFHRRGDHPSAQQFVCECEMRQQLFRARDIERIEQKLVFDAQEQPAPGALQKLRQPGTPRLHTLSYV